MNTQSRIFIAGHGGLLGSSLLRELSAQGYQHLITADRKYLDLRDSAEVNAYFARTPIDIVFLCAARVGGILANSTQKVEFLYDNLMIAANVIKASADTGVKKLINLGSSCIYPREAPQPMREDYLLEGKPEPSNEAYALAKIMGLKLCQYYHEQLGKNFVSVMPCNLFGVADNFHPNHSHVIPGLLRRFHEAKIKGDASVTVWGSGRALREFLYVDDLTNALILVAKEYHSAEILNIGYGTDVSIADLARMVKSVTGFTGEIIFDSSKMDGNPRKLLNSDRVFSLGWAPKVSLREGLERTYSWALKEGVLVENRATARENQLEGTSWT